MYLCPSPEQLPSWETAGESHLSLSSSCSNILPCLKNMKKTWLRVDMPLEKERSILIDFSNSYGNALLMLEQNFGYGLFLRGWWQVRAEPCPGL